jgi:AbrB family looped-hinge helix DNA binding protein
MIKFRLGNRPLKIFAISKIGPKGQVVIPAEARSEMALNPGDIVVVLGLANKKTVLIVGEKAFNEYSGNIRRHFGFLNEYENLKKNRAEKFDD